MSEGSGALWKYVRGKLLPPGIHVSRIEAGQGEVESGFPDVFYTYRHENGISHTGTIELKFLRKKNLPFGDDGLRKSQKIWIRDEIEAGGTVWIIADIGKTINLVRGKYWKEFNEWDAIEFEQSSTVIFPKGKTRILEERKLELAIFL